MVSSKTNEIFKKTALNVAITLFLLFSLKFAKFSTLSIFKEHENKEITKTQNYLFAALFIFVWIMTHVVGFVFVIIVYVTYASQKNNLGISVVLKQFYEKIVSYFTPHAYVVPLVFFVIVLLNLILMSFYIETKYTDNIIFDKSEESEEPEIDDDDRSLQSEPDNDKNGIGFIYRLVEFIYKMDLCIMVFIVFVIDWLRLIM